MRSNEFQRKLEMAQMVAGAGLIIAAGAGGCLLRGMFFAGEMYILLTVWFVLCTLWSGIGVLAAGLGRIKGSRMYPSSPTDRSYHHKTPVILLVCPLLILALYSLHGLRGSISAQGTVDEMLRWGLYTGFAAVAYLCARTFLGGRLLAAVWHLTGMSISMSALLAVCGILKLPYAVAYSQSPEVSATGARLGGLLEYPNTFGAVMAVFLLERLFAVAMVQPQADAAQEPANGSGGRSDGAGGGQGAGVRDGQAGAGVRGGQVAEVRGGQGAGVRDGRARAGVGEGQVEGVRGGQVAGVRDGQARVGEGQAGAGVRGGQVEGVRDGQVAGVREGQAEVREGQVAEGFTDGQGAGGTARQLLQLLPLFPYAAALLLSESRGAMLTAACASAAVLLWKRRLTAPLLAAGAAPVAAAALLYRQLAPAALAVKPLPGLLLLAGLWAGALLAGLWLCRRSRSAAGRVRAAALVLAAACWTAAGTAVLQLVRERITGPSPTVTARGLLYRDAWKLADEAPWLGRGGGTWRSSYLAAQSRPYVGSQVHSGYLDILLNIGIVGLAVCLLLLLSAGWLTGRYAPRLLPPVLVIILHGAVDFDWSYSLVWLLLFLLPALALAEARQECRSSAARSIIHVSASYIRTLHSLLSAIAARICLCCLCIVLALLSAHMVKGASLYQQAAHVQEAAERRAILRESLKWNPLQPGTAVSLSRLLPDDEAAAVLLGSLKYSPANAAVHWEIAGRYLQGDDPGQALQWVRRSLQLDVFNASKRIDSVRGMLAMSRRSLQEGKQEEAVASAAAGLELLRAYRLLAAREERRGEGHNDRLFGITEEAEALNLQLRLEMKSAYAIKR